MRDTHQEILFSVTGQLLVWDAPEGRPSSVVSVSVKRTEADDDGATEFAPTGTIEANPSTTLDAAAGADEADPKNIPLAATTGAAAGRQYLLASVANGLSEWVDVEKVISATSVSARQPLLNVYAANDTFKSTRITAPVDATWVAEANKISPEASTFPYYRVIWTYVVGGVTCRHQSFIDLVRYSAYHTVTPPDVDRIKAGWLDELPVDSKRDQGRALIEEAFRAVRMDMLADEKATRWVRHLDVVNELVAYRAVERAARMRAVNFGVGFNAAYQLAKDDYRQRYDQLIREPKVPIQATPGGAATAGLRVPILRR